MLHCGNHYATDKEGNEILLSSTGQQVMMEWEKPYMHHLVRALNITAHADDVLEIGFGCGFSANYIQTFEPRTHTIIECDKNVLERLEEWAHDKPSVQIIPGVWQTELSSLGGE